MENLPAVALNRDGQVRSLDISENLRTYSAVIQLRQGVAGTPRGLFMAFLIRRRWLDRRSRKGRADGQGSTEKKLK
jgi:hypothetical protein